MSVTIRKIAEDLNLAVSTVSKALRDSHEISDETKRRILDYARKLEYIPNPYAGSLKNKTTKNIAVVVPEVADTFFSNAINGIELVARAKGYHVMIYLTHESREREESILQDLRGGRVDGVLISVSQGVEGNSLIHSQLVTELPLIFFDRACDGVETARVLTDDFESSYKATQHLVSRGCREIVFLAAAGELSITRQRREGFLKALGDSGVEKPEKHIVMCSEDDDKSFTVIKNALMDKQAVDGVVCSVEKLAIQAYRVCQTYTLAIPDRIKIIAFSNLQIAGLLAPSMTTVVQPAFAMGEAAATLLFKALAKKLDITKERIVLPSEICERDSTRLSEPR